jgi:hypothetical protein
MSDRYLQSLAILLAGLFSAERNRLKASHAGLSAAGAGQEPTKDAADPAKAEN